MPQPKSAPVPPEIVEGSSPKRPSSVVTDSSTTLEDSAAGATGVPVGEIAATENGGGHSLHKLGNNSTNNADAAAGGAGNASMEEKESSMMTSSLILEEGTMPLKAAEQTHDEDGKDDGSLPPNSPQSHGDGGTAPNNDASSASTLDSTEVRTAFRLSAAVAFSSERAVNSTAGGGGGGSLASRSASERSLGSHGSVRGAGWDDPAFEVDGDDHTGTTPDDEHLEEMSGNEEEDEEKDEAKRKGNKLSQALLRMGSSTVTELGSNKSSSKKNRERRNSDDDGQHGRVARFIPPATQTSTSNLMADSGGGGVRSGTNKVVMAKRNSNESQISSSGGGFRYHNRAYRKTSMNMSDSNLGVMATTSTGMSESQHHYIDPYDPLPAGAQVAAAAAASAAAADAGGGAGRASPSAIHDLPEAPRYDDDSASSVGLSNPDEQADDFKDNEDEERKNLNTKFRREYRSVAWTKLAVLAVLGASMAVVVLLIYRLAKREEQDDFKIQYDDLSAKVMSGFHHNMDMKVWSAYTLSVMYAHEGVEESAIGWPQVTLGDFYEQVEGILLTAHAGAKSVSFAPLVMDEDRASWEAYAAAEYASLHYSGDEVVNNGTTTEEPTAQQQASVWEDTEKDDSDQSIFSGNRQQRGLLGLLRGGRERDGTQSRRDLSVHPNRTVEDGIFGVADGVAHDQEEGHDYYVPVWQIAPKQDYDYHIMYDLKDEVYRDRAIKDMLFYRRPTLTEIYNGGIDPFLENRFSEPSGILFHPVFEDYCGSNIVGAIATVFTLGPQLKGLPNHINGMTIVIETNTGQKFTYNLDGGGVAQLIGTGDLHDTKYDNMVLELPFNLQSYQVYDDDEREADCARRLQPNELKEGSLPSGAEQLIGEGPLPGFGVDADEVNPLVVYNIKIYPSKVFEDQYMTRHPAIYALVIGIIFLVTSATFLIYDCLVEKRQKVVMKTAVKSTKIVNNLFPSQVRDRLFHQESDDEPEDDHNKDPLPMTVPGMVSSPVAEVGQVGEDIESGGGAVKFEIDDDANSDEGAIVGRHSAPERRLSNGSGRPKRRGSMGGFGGFSVGTGGGRKGGLNKIASNYSGFSGNGSDDHTMSTNITMGIHGPPIADLFPHTTIMFADIAGFTAWSSEREPVQVFQLLEALYREFDRTAKRSGVFKVETIGDCYVAVAGLPDPQPEHALIMCKFAQKCLHKFNDLSKELELSLGPGTADLGLRVGLHSGPVTAGVLRGERARFQLFGDTMNTASRMESTSLKNMVQISQSTADILAASGREQMFIAREGLVQAKGKGEVQTYWLRPKSTRVASLHSYQEEDEKDLEDEKDDSVSKLTTSALNAVGSASGASPAPSSRNIAREASQRSASTSKSLQRNLSNSDLLALNDMDKSYHGVEHGGPSEELQRLVRWNAAVLERFLVRVMDHADIYQRMCHHPNMQKMMENFGDDDSNQEAAEIIPTPWFDREGARRSISRKRQQAKQLPEAARRELLQYVLRIALKYQAVHFHAFEHASHVLMSANKLMNKICSREFSRPPPSESTKEAKARKRDNEVGLFFSTFGIACDPLAQLAVVFAALVHDVEHTGVPNARLAVENPELAERYNNKSLAEQNSAHVAWDVLMEPEFVNLRQCMFSSACSRERFHKLLINVLIATDIADRDRIGKEKLRWKNAFEGIENWTGEWKGKGDDELANIDVSDKATCVLEQIVLASDIAHTMQHWLTFVKWNERLYRELWAAYRAGRAENDPTIGWYEGQIGFYDGYIIPLATKLKECGVFGTAGEEYLGNALRNKQEWIEKGREISARFDETIKNPDLMNSSGL